MMGARIGYTPKYYIQAKRKGTNEEWSEWTGAENYQRALEHVEYARKVGYDSRLVPSRAVKRLWDILEGVENKIELTEKIIDADFCLRDEAVNATISNLKRAIHNKAVYPLDEDCSFINLKVFDAVLQSYRIPIQNADGENVEQISQ